ncbi:MULTISPECIES: acetylglutamate kinase [Sporosarcina]|uniref:Acetylglutamate kinase n=1 Tax=Sporosarcina contaminans TaxID=633403 RepID=A0ABW3U1G3_9BACL
MTMSKLMQRIAHKRVVIKLGGSMIDSLEESFFARLRQMRNDGMEMIIVHGGGPSINAALEKKGIVSTSIDGIRVTCSQSIEVVNQVLISEVNTALVHQMNEAGIESIGLSGFDGKLLSCKMLNKETYGYVGEIELVNHFLIDKLLQADIVPVISCIGTTADGHPLNINADTVASKVAQSIGSELLYFVSDTPGITISGNVQQKASPSAIYEWIAAGEIYGGMIPKVKAALSCIEEGIPSVEITDQQLKGTMISHEEVCV